MSLINRSSLDVKKQKQYKESEMSDGEEHITLETETTKEPAAPTTLRMIEVMSLLMDDWWASLSKGEMWEQLELLWTLVKVGTQQGEAAPTTSDLMRTSSGENKVKLLKLSKEDDVETYQTTFERMMVASVQGTGQSLAVQARADADWEGTACVCNDGASNSSRLRGSQNRNNNFYVAMTSAKRLIVDISKW